VETPCAALFIEPASPRSSIRIDLLSVKVSYNLRGTSYLLHRMGWTPQKPVRRAKERDEDAITMWSTETWAKVRG
jgi:transposase